MEADWSAEIGAGLPEIVLPWAGLIDLGGLGAAEIRSQVPEAADTPGLALALAQLNAAASPVRTSKCDVWTLGADEIDVYEFDTTVEEAQHGRAAYMDIVPQDLAVFASFTLTEEWARAFARALAVVPVSSARAEVVVRGARIEDTSGFALTLYAFGCGRDKEAAERAWSAALDAAATATMATVPEAADAGE